MQKECHPLPHSKYLSIGFEGKEFAEVAALHECLKLNVPPQTHAEFIQHLDLIKNTNSGL
jgi:hypothetical protein